MMLNISNYAHSASTRSFDQAACGVQLDRFGLVTMPSLRRKLVMIAVRAGAVTLLFAALCHPILAQRDTTLSGRFITAIQQREPSWKIVPPLLREVYPESRVHLVFEGNGYHIRIDLIAHASDSEASEHLKRINQWTAFPRTAVLPSPETSAEHDYIRANVAISIHAHSTQNYSVPLPNNAVRPKPVVIVNRVARIIDDLISTEVKVDACINELYADPRPAPASRLEAFVRDIEAGCLPRVQQALVDGINANARDPQGTTALMLAVTAGRREVSRALLQSGADPNVVVGATGTAIFRVFSRPSVYKAEDLQLILANQLGILDDLVSAGANLEARNEQGRTLLLDMARMNYDDGSPKVILKGLIERAADLSARDREGRTAIILAILHTHPKVHLETLPVLLGAGGDVKAADVFGKTAVDYVKERADKSNPNESQSVLRLLTEATAMNHQPGGTRVRDRSMLIRKL